MGASGILAPLVNADAAVGAVGASALAPAAVPLWVPQVLVAGLLLAGAAGVGAIATWSGPGPRIRARAQRPLVIRGVVDDPDARLVVHGRHVELREDRSFALDIFEAEPPGRVRVEAVDRAGNRTERDIAVDRGADRSVRHDAAVAR